MAFAKPGSVCLLSIEFLGSHWPNAKSKRSRFGNGCKIIENEVSTQYKFNMEGGDDLEKWHNVDLLVQANLITDIEVHWAADGTGPYANAKGLVALTWDGHDFLDAVLNDSIWQQANERAKALGLDMQSMPFGELNRFAYR